MTDATLSYARALRRHALACGKVRMPVTITVDPISAAHLADIIERGCRRSDYVRTVQAEAERLRDVAEDELIRAQDLNAAADRALERARVHHRRAWRVYWLGLAFVVLWGSVLAALA